MTTYTSLHYFGQLQMALQVKCAKTTSKIDINFHIKTKFKKQLEKHCMLSIFTSDISCYTADVTFIGIQPYWHCLLPLASHGYTKNIEGYAYFT